MQATRRTFLGSVIGALVVGGAPVIARPIPHPLAPNESIKDFMDAWNCPVGDLMRLRLSLEMEINGVTEWIEGDLNNLSRNPHEINFYHAPFHCKERTICHGIAIHKEDGTVISRRHWWGGSQLVNPGDTFNGTFAISAPLIFEHGQVRRIRPEDARPDVATFDPGLAWALDPHAVALM
jgi:hypothetical protein